MELLRCYVIVVILSHILIATRVSGSTRLVLEVVIHIIIVAIITIIIIIIVIAVIFTNIVMIIVVISSVEMEVFSRPGGSKLTELIPKSFGTRTCPLESDSLLRSLENLPIRLPGFFYGFWGDENLRNDSRHRGRT